MEWSHRVSQWDMGALRFGMNHFSTPPFELVTIGASVKDAPQKVQSFGGKKVANLKGGVENNHKLSV